MILDPIQIVQEQTVKEQKDGTAEGHARSRTEFGLVNAVTNCKYSIVIVLYLNIYFTVERCLMRPFNVVHYSYVNYESLCLSMMIKLVNT